MIRYTLLLLVTMATLLAAADTVTVHEPWSRSSAGAARVGAVFAELRNPTDTPVRIVSGISPACARVELHTHEHLPDGSARMIEIPSIDIPAQGSVLLKPGGLHLMLIDLHERLVEGGTVEITLTTADGTTVPVQAVIKSIAAMSVCCDG